mgnify:CR=1 FL=1
MEVEELYNLMEKKVINIHIGILQFTWTESIIIF